MSLTKKNPQGFTLMELLVAMGIIGLLATTVAASASVARAESRNVKRRAEARTLLSAMLQYQADHAEALPTGVDGTSRMLGTNTTSCNIACSLGDPVEEEIELLPVADSYIYEYTPTQNYGTQTQMHVYPRNIGLNRRSLIKFDLSTIPQDATISSAILTLKEAGTYGMPRTLALHRATRNWTEGSVTWRNYNALNPWTAQGGDFNPNASATASVVWQPPGFLDSDTWDVTQDVQQFISRTYDNYGWILKDTVEDTSERYWFFSTRESAEPPKLTIRYAGVTVGEGVAAQCLDIYSLLVPDYINKIPIDPRTGSAGQTYYVVRQAPNGEVFVRACGAELGETIISQGS